MKIFGNFLIIVFLFLPWYNCEVQFTIILHPPMATLECLIIHAKEDVSAILMCPNDLMCFQNCYRICDEVKCKSNNISCSFEKIGTIKKFTYVFNVSNLLNQGEWTCHYGTEKSSTAIIYRQMFPEYVKRQVDMVTIASFKNDSFDSNLKKIYINEKPKEITTTAKWKSITQITQGPVFSNISPYYVILLLLVFSISLLINIIFLVRDILTSVSTRKSIHDKKESSNWLRLCVKLFCVEKIFKIKKPYETNQSSHEINPLLSRQVSSNIYEYPVPIQVQGPILLENLAYMGTPYNERLAVPNNFIRSQSFPMKHNDSNSYSINQNAIKLIQNRNGSNYLIETPSINELSSQIIYDDVAEPSIHYRPSDNPIYYSSLVRPSYRIGRQPFKQQRDHLTVGSMNNIDIKSKYPNDSILGLADSDTGTSLKDAINSRVELSKEMISQADTLLRQADNLLSKKESS